MIHHLVLFRLRPGVAREDARLARVLAQMDELPGRIGLIRGWEHGWNLVADAQAWDYGLHAQFGDRAALEAYFDHPAHLPVLAQWEEIAGLAFCDFEE